MDYRAQVDVLHCEIPNFTDYAPFGPRVRLARCGAEHDPPPFVFPALSSLTSHLVTGRNHNVAQAPDPHGEDTSTSLPAWQLLIVV